MLGINGDLVQTYKTFIPAFAWEWQRGMWVDLDIISIFSSDRKNSTRY